MMRLYHGTDLESAKRIREKIEITKGDFNSDFGQGFYTTNDEKKAKKWAIHVANVLNLKPAIVTVIFDDKGAEPIIERFSDDMRWGQFVINNRNGMDYINKIPFKEHNLDGKYDITIGRIADMSIISVADSLKESGKMLESLDSILKKTFPLQIVFHTEKSLQYILNVSYRCI